jgi:hypothetical protein
MAQDKAAKKSGWRPYLPWFWLALWVGSAWIGFNAVEAIRDAYDTACNPAGDIAVVSCKSIQPQIETFILSLLVNLIGIPAAILWRRRQ